MKTRLGVVMDPIANVNYAKDSTLALLWAAQDRGWDLFYMEQGDLFLRDGVARASVRHLEVQRDQARWFTLGAPRELALGELDALLMRKDPPFDSEFLYSTHILEAGANDGCLVVNEPRALRDCNEKLFATRFPQCCPPLLVSRDPARLREFQREHGDVILKPLDAMGGAAVFRVRDGDPNFSVILETLTAHGSTTIMAQRYIPQIVDGDKRILMIDGEPVPYALARIPQAGETRGNLAAGGRGEARALSERDRWIASEVGPELRARGLLFVGLDVIGDYLTEINVTSPTCIRELDKACGLDIGAALIDAVAARLER
ncbi:MAG: glutathione synthase [Pseudomonadales bacterium]|jgi:glutathione synthase|nr:glutathione synthase [Pseudomonadales bacterium]MCP5337330.1 glutathione synthase [Pseudomonadales bacterium]